MSKLTDFDTAYDNGKAIADFGRYPAFWSGQAAAFRDDFGERWREMSYGPAERHRFDLFEPEDEAKGTLVYVHGGYWKAFDKSFWSHLASGAIALGWRVAMPSYTLCPQARISEITREIGMFLDSLAAEVNGEIALTGHSAGGHLVTRMACENAPISPVTAKRIVRVLSISGLHDLRPLLPTQMNMIFGMDADEAARESAVLLTPRTDLEIQACCGQGELPEFRRQSTLIADIWHGFGIATDAWEIPDAHHANVIETLCDPQSRALGFLCP
ncbi:alpha/beta hydrolase [Limoniibacter endophyticus]|uniref:Esterase n=1 Tax=Limoniibacter endophyticus TaxID=1565040 RepID=A0A8J3DRN0_9HYPH|nr:alpha/beta hydrolase fold domain-containing protein [Limoniibacter endophyticus]GHC70235.1 esterase [Limoniibacter endophyticus]